MAADTNFRQGDTEWDLARKILQRLNSFINVASDTSTQFAQGDTLYNIKRKTLRRLNQLFPSATGDVVWRQGDSQWSIERKILLVLNQDTAIPIPETPAVVQSKWGSGSADTTSVTLTGVTAGNMIVVVAAIVATSPAAPVDGDCVDGVSDYTVDSSTPAINTFYRFAVWSKVAAVSGNLTITVGNGGVLVNALNVCAYEISGLALKMFDSGNDGVGTSATPTTDIFGTSSAGVIVAVEAEFTGGAGITHTAGPGYSISDSGNAHGDENSGALLAGCAEHRVTTGALDVTNASCVLAPDQSWGILAAAYK
jgi:hypothetical protein